MAVLRKRGGGPRSDWAHWSSRSCPTPSVSRISARCWCASRASPRAPISTLSPRRSARSTPPPSVCRTRSAPRIPHPPLYALANFDPTDIAASIAAQFLGDPNAPLQFPKVNRKDKRDSFLARSRAPLPPLPPLLAVEPVPQAQADAPLKSDETGRFDPYADYQFAAAARRAVDAARCAGISGPTARTARACFSAPIRWRRGRSRSRLGQVAKRRW